MNDNPRTRMVRAMEQAGMRRLVVHVPVEMGAPAWDGIAGTFDPGQERVIGGEHYKTWDAWVPDDEVMARDGQGGITRTLRAGEHVPFATQLRAEGFEQKIMLGTVEEISRATTALAVPGREIRAVPRADELVVLRDGTTLCLEDVWVREGGKSAVAVVQRLEGLRCNADGTISGEWDVYRLEAGR